MKSKDLYRFIIRNVKEASDIRYNATFVVVAAVILFGRFYYISVLLRH